MKNLGKITGIVAIIGLILSLVTFFVSKKVFMVTVTLFVCVMLLLLLFYIVLKVIEYYGSKDDWS